MSIKTKPKTSLQERLRLGTVLCAEGYIFELERRGYVKAGAYVPEVVLEHPEVVEQLHKEFLNAGSDVLVALTYYAHREKLKVIGRENDLEELNRQAIRIAVKVAGDHDVLVAGNICNTWAYEPNNPIAAEEVRRQYTEQVRWAKEEGVDFILAETLEYLGEALIALEVIQSFGLPSVINFSAIYEKTKDDHDWIEAAKIVSEKGADVVGFNCARGPETILPLGEKLRKAVNGPLALVPVPYYTDAKTPAFQFLKGRDGSSAYTLGLDQHLIDRTEAANFARQAIELDIRFIGLCCGAGPQHIRSIAEALGRLPEASRYSADLSQHGLLGSKKVVAEHEREFLKRWN